MTRDDIIRMAREAGFEFKDRAEPKLERFASLVAAAEREACAEVCDEMWTGYGDCGAICSSAIRARSNT